MKRLVFALLCSCFTCFGYVNAQIVNLEPNKLEAVNVSMSVEKLMDRKVVKVIKDSTVKGADAPTYVKVKGLKFKNGTIEVTVLSRLVPNAGATARGFIGIAFRATDSNSKFESIYIRPTNGRADDQLRRNHATQYFSYPDYDFDRLRKESPGVYESYADMGLNEWIKLKIVVKGTVAKLFINDSKQPCLIVNDLKHGPNLSGSVGLWVDGGTEGYFSGLKVKKEE